jgi:hypothetical protein
MRLQAVRDAARVVDFRWEFVGTAAARLLNCAAHTLLGKGLREVAAGPLAHPALIERYRRVVECGNAQSFEQVHRIDGTQVLIAHHVARAGDGVEVTLINLSARMRFRMALEPAARALIGSALPVNAPGQQPRRALFVSE